MLVTLAGHDILRGRALRSDMPASDYAHMIVACLFHDIGYVRGMLPGDDDEGFVVDDAGRKVKVPRGSSDAALPPITSIAPSCSSAIASMASPRSTPTASAAPSRAPASPARCRPTSNEVDEEVALLRAADLIGQLGDPHYIRKANALYYEFEEAGLNRQLDYASPADLVERYPQFYWNMISPFIQPAIRHLQVTSNGRQWVANLYSNVFRAERDLSLCGPQQ